MNSAKKKTVNFKTNIKNSSKANNYYILSGIIILTIIIYSKSIFGDFLNWDDDVYITKNPDILNVSLHGFRKIFTNFYLFQYIPLTMLSFAIEFKLFGLNPIVFHTVNLIFHILNIILVYFLINQLFKKHEIAAITALFFAIHPMHVESVAWISERKDVLYTFFYLLSFIFYVKYIQKFRTDGLKFTDKPKFSFLQIFSSSNLLISIFFYILSFLSKSMAAATLPLILILADWLLGRKIRINAIYDKIPFFIISLFFSIFIIVSQKVYVDWYYDPNVLNKNMIDRFFMSNYAVSFYIVKLFFPFQLSAIHPFPSKIDGYLPLEYYLSPLLLISILYLIFRVIKRKTISNVVQHTHKLKGNNLFSRINEHQSIKIIIFGTVFFLVSIFPVVFSMKMLGLAGHAIVCERFTYVPYLGFFILAGSYYSSVINNTIKYAAKTKPYVIALFVIFTISFSVLSYGRVAVWKDSTKLSSDIIKNYPNHYHGYWLRGVAQSDKKNYKAAIADLNKALELGNPESSKVLIPLGLALYKIGDYKTAIEVYNKAIGVNPNISELYYNRGISKFKLGDDEGALIDFNNTVNLNPNYYEAYNNRGFIKSKMNDFEGAIQDYNNVIRINPTDSFAYNNRGYAKLMTKDYQGAYNDILYSIKIFPENSYAYRNLGLYYIEIKDEKAACESLNKAVQLGYTQKFGNDVKDLLYKICN